LGTLLVRKRRLKRHSDLMDHFEPVEDSEDNEDEVEALGVLGLRPEVRLGLHDVNSSRLSEQECLAVCYQ